MKYLTPNYKIMFDSAVCALQQAYKEYRKSVMDNLKWTWIDNNGEFVILDGAEERNRKIKELEYEVVRLMFRVREIKAEKEQTE